MESATGKMIEVLLADPIAPRDYIVWLEQNGWGELGDGAYTLYSGLVPLQEISPDAPSGYWAFGDDFTDYSGCFSETCDGSVHEWNSSTGEISATGKSFTSFISKWANAL